jgi:SAM-dependent methyltransferase
VARRQRGFYERQVLPRLLNALSGAASLDPLRRRACTGLAGDVVELGFGSGYNVPFYPAGVTSVAAIEPSDLSWRLAGPRLAAASVPVHRAGLDGQALPLADASQDAVLTTWTLCTIPDAAAALREARRVLRPGGTLHFLEHGLAPDEHVRKWQRRLDPLERRLVGGCSFVRPIVELVEGAGFTIREVDVFYQEGAPRVSGADSLGVAVSGG